MSEPVINESNEAPLFQAINMAVLPLWAAMILAPNSAITKRIMSHSDKLLAGFSLAYAAQMGLTIAGADTRPDFGNVAALRENMGKPDGFLVGWTHFLAFDLFVGRWIWQTAQEEGRSARVATFLTFLTGPAGLGVFAAQRRRS